MIHTAQPELFSGALDNLMRHLLTGCVQSAQRAVLLLGRIESSESTDAEMRDTCERMREQLEDGRV
ncbi:MAG: hypothetical protein IPG66_07635 [Hydrogenophilales bacterium]|nr:hypothetical protein [Hydrogenophilales bacterium]